MAGISYKKELEDNASLMARDARMAFGEWLSRPQWSWFTSHTFKLEFVSPKRADRAWYSWFNGLRVSAKALGYTPSLYGESAPFYFRVAEYQDRGTLHFHALIGNVGDIRRLLFKDMWELNGFARVLKYEAGKGANYYLGKYLTKADGDMRFSHNLTHHLKQLDTSDIIGGNNG